MITVPVAITALPEPPSTASPSDFDSKADAFLGAFPTLRTEINTISNTTYNNALEANTFATEASSFANAAASSAVAAAAAAGAAAWVSGQTYAQSAVVVSGIAPYDIYRKITASSATTTDPSADTAGNWINITPLSKTGGTITGNLGIGTTPSTLLHLKSTTPVIQVESSGNLTTTGTAYTNFNGSNGDSGYIGFGTGSSTAAMGFYNRLSGPLVFATANTERMRVDSSGNVLVGTNTASGFKFRVVTSGDTVALAESTGLAAYINISDSTSTSSPQIGSAGNNLVFRTGISSNSERLRIDNTGNVGIGTSSPSEKLAVTGAILVSGQTTSNKIAAGTLDYYPADNSTRILSWGSAGVPGKIGFWTGSGNSGALERLNINSSGNVGINTSNPLATLDVKGTFRLSGATSGYVGFASAAAAGTTTYTLPSVDGISGQVLTTNGSATLSWTTAAVTPGDGNVGYLNVPQNSQSAAYTLVLTDAGKHIFHPSADTSVRTFTIPANSAVAFPIGTAITFVNQNGAGTISIAITTDTMRLAGSGFTGTRTLLANGTATALKITSTEWIISGVNLS